MRILAITVLAAVMLAALSFASQSARTADACAGLIGSNGNVNLGRTTTLAGYHDGVEHYVTSFEFQGGGGEFGTLIPLPGVPTDIIRGGDWTLQRLQLETAPQVEFLAASAFDEDAAAERAIVLQEVRIDALDITVLKGGSASVAQWATDHGFRLSPDAPEVLDFYAQRSPIFLAAVFDGEAAAERGQALGDGTPVHLTIPTDDPWVPLRILGLGKQSDDFVEADVFLLTDDRPNTLPAINGDGLFLQHSAQATDLLLSDLRSDQGMGWVPDQAWLTKVAVSTTAGELDYDLAVDETGTRQASRVDAGFDLPRVVTDSGSSVSDWTIAAIGIAVLIGLFALRVVGGRRRA